MRLLIVLVLAMLALAACGDDTSNGTDVETEPGDTADDGTDDGDGDDGTLDGAEDGTDDGSATGTDGTDDAADDTEGDGDAEGTGDGGESDVEMLDGEASTETSESEGEPDQLAVTDVRVGTHGDFDRVVFELEGEGTAGWNIGYVDEPTSQGSGEPIEVEGDAALHVAIHHVALPPELPEDVEPWIDETVPGPDGGVIVEVVPDTIFEGIHTFAVGVTAEQPFIVERLEDPQRVVLDIPHGG